MEAETFFFVVSSIKTSTEKPMGVRLVARFPIPSVQCVQTVYTRYIICNIYTYIYNM